MIKLPFEMVGLERWKSFKAPLPTNDKEHRIIIIYKVDNNVKYFYFTSKVDKAKIRARNDISSIAEFKENEWDNLTTDCCVQCGKAYLKEISVEELKRLYENDKLEILGEVPDVIKLRIKASICSSKTFNDIEKKIFTI